MNQDDAPAMDVGTASLLTPVERMGIASDLYGLFRDLLDQPRAAWPSAFGQRIDEVPDDPAAVTARLMTRTNEGRLTIFAFVEWAKAGFPKIAMGHRFAASLLVTTATRETVSLARSPFPAFVIELPDGLLELDDPEHSGEVMSLRSVLVCTKPDPEGRDPFVWDFTAHADRGVCVYRSCVHSLDMLPSPDGELESSQVNAFNYEATGRDQRVLWLLGRLIINTCLAMSDPSQVRMVGKAHEAWRRRGHEGSRRGSPEPVVRFFQIGRPIKHDFREAVGEYLRGERRKLSVQGIVAGHYKMQPHGPDNSLRKLIWREPFWRGPEDAPIVLRPHEFTEDAK